jgi:hypothetical protein
VQKAETTAGQKTESLAPIFLVTLFLQLGNFVCRVIDQMLVLHAQVVRP